MTGLMVYTKTGNRWECEFTSVCEVLNSCQKLFHKGILEYFLTYEVNCNRKEDD